MINRICISINNRCNLACRYCHFREKGKIESSDMNVFEILDNVKAYATKKFKIGFVGNGEGFLDWELLKSYIKYIEDITGHYPTFNATVGKESLENADKIIAFFSKYGTRVTFSRMIGKYGITLKQYRDFLAYAEKYIPVRRGGKDCTMYGGQCGAGTNNYFFANGKVYYCGNCIDLPPLGSSSMTFWELEKINLQFDRNYCYKETL